MSPTIATETSTSDRPQGARRPQLSQKPHPGRLPSGSIMITKENFPIRTIFFRDHENPGLSVRSGILAA
jgi:hypothetical protein